MLKSLVLFAKAALLPSSDQACMSHPASCSFPLANEAAHHNDEPIEVCGRWEGAGSFDCSRNGLGFADQNGWRSGLAIETAA